MSTKAYQAKAKAMLNTNYSGPDTTVRGAQQCAARGLHRPTHERPDAGSPPADPTQRWCSDCGKDGANVTGNSAPSVEMHPSSALGLYQHRSGEQVEKGGYGHPAVSMERAWVEMFKRGSTP